MKMKIFFSSLALLLTTQLAFATTVSNKAEKLQNLMGRYARNDSYKVKTGAPLQMIKNYIFAKNKKFGDTESAKEYRFVRSGKTFIMDEKIAGTLSSEVVLATVLNLEGLSKRQQQFAVTLVKEIKSAGGAFGFDGYEQNGCATPTPFLLIIDPKGKVFGIDLAPCTES